MSVWLQTCQYWWNSTVRLQTCQYWWNWTCWCVQLIHIIQRVSTWHSTRRQCLFSGLVDSEDDERPTRALCQLIRPREHLTYQCVRKPVLIRCVHVALSTLVSSAFCCQSWRGKQLNMRAFWCYCIYSLAVIIMSLCIQCLVSQSFLQILYIGPGSPKWEPKWEPMGMCERDFIDHVLSDTPYVKTLWGTRNNIKWK